MFIGSLGLFLWCCRVVSLDLVVLGCVFVFKKEVLGGWFGFLPLPSMYTYTDTHISSSHWKIGILHFTGRVLLRGTNQSPWWEHELPCGNLFSSFAKVLRMLHPKNNLLPEHEGADRWGGWESGLGCVYSLEISY